MVEGKYNLIKSIKCTMPSISKLDETHVLVRVEESRPIFSWAICPLLRIGLGIGRHGATRFLFTLCRSETLRHGGAHCDLWKSN